MCSVEAYVGLSKLNANEITKSNLICTMLIVLKIASFRYYMRTTVLDTNCGNVISYDGLIYSGYIPESCLLSLHLYKSFKKWIIFGCIIIFCSWSWIHIQIRYIQNVNWICPSAWLSVTSGRRIWEWRTGSSTHSWNWHAWKQVASFIPRPLWA